MHKLPFIPDFTELSVYIKKKKSLLGDCKSGESNSLLWTIKYSDNEFMKLVERWQEQNGEYAGQQYQYKK